ncbi:imm11 family protein [Vibrio hyugaensis]|uniref:imm11 family protein n=1 Tax=Vibrio hyugaensis TaxID=1534743 RepID=UPI000CE42D1C|nr:DUF1629 domain-containing protein [Vibrio hyugaensis]
MNYNNEYWILCPSFQDEKFHVVPSEETGLRRFHAQELVDEENRAIFISDECGLVASPPTILHCKPSLIIHSSIKELFKMVYGGKLFPAIVETPDGNMMDYYLVNVFELLDCWDRDKSAFKQKDPEYFPRVYEYSLDACVLNQIKESERLVFKMGGTDLSPMVVHEKIKNRLEPLGIGTNYFRVADYCFGDEFEE